MRVVRAMVSPLTSRQTYRRLAFLLLGGAAGFGFLSVGSILLLLVNPHSRATAALLGLSGPVPFIVGVGLLRSTLSVQRTASRTLLGAPDTNQRPAVVTWRHRWRSAMFFVVHVILGYLTVVFVFLAGALVVFVIMNAIRPGAQTIDAGTDAALNRYGLVAVVLALLSVPYVGAGLGAVLARLARRLLGTTPDERLADLEQQVHDLAERNRLARELHDSVGHALSVVTVQAGAAQRTLDHDPEVARSALAAIADSARRALADLDHVLALLREEPATVRPKSTLDHLDHLVTDLRSAGLPIEVRRSGELAAVPAVVSREAYRIIQEGLTNALRHAGHAPVCLRVRATDGALELELDNPLPIVPSARRSDAGGHGLTGVRERVALLGGQVSAGPAGGQWRLWVRVPLAVAS